MTSRAANTASSASHLSMTHKGHSCFPTNQN